MTPGVEIFRGTFTFSHISHLPLLLTFMFCPLPRLMAFGKELSFQSLEKWNFPHEESGFMKLSLKRCISIIESDMVEHNIRWLEVIRQQLPTAVLN